MREKFAGQSTQQPVDVIRAIETFAE